MSFNPKSAIKDLPTSPGVYRYYDSQGSIIYVGKAKDLKKRVSSYFMRTPEDKKTQVLVKQIAGLDTTVTHTEREALILENNLIKQHRPRYNVLFRDDKSYPYIYISDEAYPRMVPYRGNRKLPGKFYGPYLSLSSVRKTINLLQKIFKIRSCAPHEFSHRSRPCLQYQIKRCSAPCVAGHISDDSYQQAVEHVRAFLQGKNQQVLDTIANKMHAAAKLQQFEQAAILRDQLQDLQQLQESQAVSGEVDDMVDIIALAEQNGQFCVQVMLIRQGNVIANRRFFPKVQAHEQSQTVLQAFSNQYYTVGEGADNLPDSIVAQALPEQDLLEHLAAQKGRKVKWLHKPTGRKWQWLQLVKTNAWQSLQHRMRSIAVLEPRFTRLQQLLGLSELPKTIECYDISHSSGEHTTASCVVFDINGPVKANYRSFNIKTTNSGDDYAAMHEALLRRFSRLKSSGQTMPEVALIDGGKGQLQQAISVLSSLQIAGITIIGVAKGKERKPGMEQLWLPDRDRPLAVASDDPALLLIQQVRDEAHRFAITCVRNKRTKSSHKSQLEQIPGVGPKRRTALLHHFGGWQRIKAAPIDEIAKVPGISKDLAAQIHKLMHDNHHAITPNTDSWG